MSHHKCVGGKNGGRNGGASVDGKEGVDSGELAADFFFLDVEESSNVYDHLLMGESQLAIGRAVRRGRGDDVGGVAGAIGRRRRARGNENGGGGVRHRWYGRTVVWDVMSKGVG